MKSLPESSYPFLPVVSHKSFADASKHNTLHWQTIFGIQQRRPCYFLNGGGGHSFIPSFKQLLVTSDYFVEEHLICIVHLGIYKWIFKQNMMWKDAESLFRGQECYLSWRKLKHVIENHWTCMSIPIYFWVLPKFLLHDYWKLYFMYLAK